MICFYITERQKRDIKVGVVFQRCRFEERERNCVNKELGEKLQKCPKDAKLVMEYY